jgi:hypothetical protein
MTSSRIALALGMMLMAAPAAGGILDGKSTTKAAETVGPAAAGDPKPYWARAAADCTGDSCLIDFGKKGNKARTIDWINCAFGVNDGLVRIGLVAIGDLKNQHGYFSSVSSVMDGTDETAVIEYKNRMMVPAGSRLIVYMTSTGTPGGGQCTAGGTIE